MQKNSYLDLFFQLLPPVFFLSCAIFCVFVGIRLLAFMDSTSSSRVPLKWPEAGFEQLQQMNNSIKQALDLIVDLRKENQALQEQLTELSTKSENTKDKEIKT